MSAFPVRFSTADGGDFSAGTAAGDGRDRPLPDRHRPLPRREEALGYGE